MKQVFTRTVPLAHYLKQDAMVVACHSEFSVTQECTTEEINPFFLSPEISFKRKE